MKRSPVPTMKVPATAENWEHIVHDDGDEHWTALIPSTIDRVIVVSQKEPGAWSVEMDQAEGRLEHAPPLPAGPFASAAEAMRAADAWCAKWAPRVVGLPSIYSLRVCSDGKIRVSPYEDGADRTDPALTADEARTLADALMALANEASATSIEALSVEEALEFLLKQGQVEMRTGNGALAMDYYRVKR